MGSSVENPAIHTIHAVLVRVPMPAMYHARMAEFVGLPDITAVSHARPYGFTSGNKSLLYAWKMSTMPDIQ
jgi:hypothetical protein